MKRRIYSSPVWLALVFGALLHGATDEHVAQLAIANPGEMTGFACTVSDPLADYNRCVPNPVWQGWSSGCFQRDGRCLQ